MSVPFQLALGNNTPTNVNAPSGTISLSSPSFLDIGGGLPGQVLTTDGDVNVRWANVTAGGTDAPADGGVYGRRNGNWSLALPLAGGSLTGMLTLLGPPVNPLHAATKAYVDAALFVDAPNDTFSYGRASLAWSRVVPLAGGTMTGLLTLSGPPTANLHAATKAYVDGKIGPVLVDGVSVLGNGTTIALSVGNLDAGTY